jgi:hypothetical protein
MKKIVSVVMLFALLFAIGCKPQTPEKELTFTGASVLANGSVHIEGRGRAFEGTIGIKIVDVNENVLFYGSVITDAGDMSKFGNFSQDTVLTMFPQTDDIIIECFIASPKDGSITASEKKVIKYDIPYRTVKVFFGNIKLNPEMIDCTKVFPVDRRLDSKFFTSGTDYVVETLKLFLKGPTQKEKGEEYAITTPQNLTINFVKVSGKNVQVDFGKELFEAGGGSCKVGAIGAEITETVQQFFPGYQVIISANGNSEEVLQP